MVVALVLALETSSPLVAILASTRILVDTGVGGWVGQIHGLNDLIRVIIPLVKVAINIYLSNDLGNSVAISNVGCNI